MVRGKIRMERGLSTDSFSIQLKMLNVIRHLQAG